MTLRAQRRAPARARPASARPERRRRRPTTGAIEADRGPFPEAVFDRITGPYGGPYVHRPALALPGACEHDEEM
jgi:hypothetical protein